MNIVLNIFFILVDVNAITSKQLITLKKMPNLINESNMEITIHQPGHESSNNNVESSQDLPTKTYTDLDNPNGINNISKYKFNSTLNGKTLYSVAELSFKLNEPNLDIKLIDPNNIPLYDEDETYINLNSDSLSVDTESDAEETTPTTHKRKHQDDDDEETKDGDDDDSNISNNNSTKDEKKYKKSKITIISINETNLNKEECSTCKKQIKIDKMINHKRVCKGLPCSKCNVKFMTRSVLNRHENTCKGKKI